MNILQMQSLVLDLWNLALYHLNALQTYVDKRGIDYYRMFPWQNAIFSRRCLVFNLFRILWPFLTSFDIMDSTVKVTFALVMITKSFIFQVVSTFVYHRITQVKNCFIVLIILLHSQSPYWKHLEFCELYQPSWAPRFFFLTKLCIILLKKASFPLSSI